MDAELRLDGPVPARAVSSSQRLRDATPARQPSIALLDEDRAAPAPGDPDAPVRNDRLREAREGTVEVERRLAARVRRHGETARLMGVGNALPMNGGRSSAADDVEHLGSRAMRNDDLTATVGVSAPVLRRDGGAHATEGAGAHSEDQKPA